MDLGGPDQLVCALLRGEAADWSGGGDPEAAAHFIDAGRYHGVLPLLDARLRSRQDFAAWPEEIRTACRQATTAQARFEFMHAAEVERVLAELARAAVTPLLLKGTGLAYSHYPSPLLRPRVDTDLLIPRGQLAPTESTLGAVGYTRNEGVEGEFISYQATWSRSDRFGMGHHLDVHWQINNSQILARVLTCDDLAARARPVPALGPNARTLAPVDALLLACMHRAGHLATPFDADGAANLGADRLIWLYDIHLLVTRMSAAELDEFAELAATKRIKAICLDAVARAGECFATEIPSRVLEQLNAPGPVEPSVIYLSGGMMRQLIGDFGALETWGDRMRWLKELAFPSAHYMRLKYPDAAKIWLPVLYVRRGLTGLLRRLFARDAGHRH